MCFSATASFAASGGLAVVGAMSMPLARKRQKLIAAIPFLFAIQQAIEGFQWLSAESGATCTALGYGFLFFAFLLWPLYIPLTVFVLDEKKRKTLRWLVGIGAVVSLSLLAVLLVQPLTVHVFERSIHYQTIEPSTTVAAVLLALYLVAVIGALVVSSKPAFRWIGMLVLIAATSAVLFSETTFVSVWCFFAALLSSLVYFYLKSANNDIKKMKHP